MRLRPLFFSGMSLAVWLLLGAPAGATLHFAPPQSLPGGVVRIEVSADAPMDADALEFDLPLSFQPSALSETPEPPYAALDRTITPRTVLFFGLQTMHIEPGPLFHWDFVPADAGQPLAGFAPTLIADESGVTPLPAASVPEPRSAVVMLAGILALLVAGGGRCIRANVRPERPRRG